ncbi:amino acid ABC transporter substrate-binding protein [Halopenitus sp. POP-27]|uniref:amino acid ABC transporter substrate-binding protein n=1 Tax=Halopenitus sp. POP-27 TaxID=2994425 RepID=UPI002468B1ED|nr:amino acid ABC transporter substrate-binding protein [Halopenitus sp. POP-27]
MSDHNDSEVPRNRSATPRFSRRRFVETTAAAGALAATAGCMGGGGGGDDVITIGASTSTTGPTATEGVTMKEGYDFWIHQINEGNSLLADDDEGLLGREVELVHYDDQSDPSRGVNLYQRLINEDEVDVLLGPYGSTVSSAVIPIIEDAEMACIMPMMSDTSVLEERDVQYTTQAIAPAYTYVRSAIDIAVENGAETIAVVYEDAAFPTSVASGHIPYAEEQGLEVVHEEAYPTDINDYSSVLNTVAEEDPDIVMGGGYTEDAIGLTQAAQSVGLSPGIFAWVVGGMAPAFAESVGDAALGVTGDLFWAPFFELPYNQEFTEGFMDLFSEEYSDPGEVDYHAAGGYAGCLVMEQAIRNVGEIDQTAIAEQLHEIEMEIPFANGVYEVDDQGIQVGQTPSLGQWQEGEDGMTQEAVRPAEYATADPIYPHPGW